MIELKRSVSGHALLDFWRRYRKNRAAILGFVGVALALFIAVCAHVVYPYDPFSMRLHEAGQSYVTPSLEHIMGTDQFGRDVFGRTLYGIRTSLLVGASAALISALLGISLGAIAGYKGGITDEIIMRVVDASLTIPTFFLALVIVAMFGSSISFVALVIGFTMWPSTSRLIRAEFLLFKEQTFVESARAVGCGDAHIIFREILPNAIFPAVVNLSLQIAMAILDEVSLSFLGLGDPNQISLGMMLNEAMPSFRRAWWLGVFPGLVISALVISFNLVGDGINDALNPHLKER